MQDTMHGPGDPLLRRIAGEIPEKLGKELQAHGAWAGNSESLEMARLANRNLPVLKTHDTKGNRIDLVEYHPAYHALMRKSVSAGLHVSIWEDNAEEAGRAKRNSGSQILYDLPGGGRASLSDHHDECCGCRTHELAAGSQRMAA